MPSSADLQVQLAAFGELDTQGIPAVTGSLPVVRMQEAAAARGTGAAASGAATGAGEGAPERDTPGEGAPEGGAQRSLGRSTALMASGTAVSRALGLIRNVVLVAAIGVTAPVANAFDAANTLPNMMFAVLAGGVLNAVLVPQIVRAYQSRNPDERINKMLTAAGLLILLVTTLATITAAASISVVTSGQWPPEQRHLAILFAYWCIPQLFFYGVYTLLGQVLNARGQFGPYMWTPALNNIVAIAGTLVFIVVYGRYSPTGTTSDPAAWTSPMIALLAGTATLGIAVQAFALVVPLRRGGFRYRPQLGLRGIGLRGAGQVAMWTFAAVVLEQVGVGFVKRFASAAEAAAGALGEGAPAIAGNAAYSQALMIYLLPHSLVTVSIATALFTHISGAAARGQRSVVRATVSRGLRTIGVFTIFATAVLVVLAGPLTKALIPTTSPASGRAIAGVLAAMALGLTALGGMVLAKWVYFAYEDGRTVFMIQIPTTFLLVAFSWLGTEVLPPRLWVVGIGLAMSLSNTITFLLRIGGLRRTLGGLDGWAVLQQHVRVLLSTLVAAVVGAVAVHLMPDVFDGGWLVAIVVLVVCGTLMTATYLLMLRVTRVTELSDLAAPFTARLRRLVRR